MATNGQRPAIWRHLSAVLVDMALIGTPTTVAIAALHERFSILATSDGSPRFSPADQARINEIDRGFNRGLHFGDDIYTLSGSGWWLTMLVLSAATITVFVVAPAVMGRRTPGQRLIGMTPLGESTVVTLIDSPIGIDLSDSSGHAQAADSDTTQKDDPPASDEQAAMVDIRTEASVEPADQPCGETTAPGSTIDDRATESTIDVDITDRPPSIPISLADDSEYERWDRDQARGVSSSSSGVATMVAEAKPEQRLMPTGPPEWSADWNAWMYWDPASKRWFKHDTGSDRWSPVS